MEKRRGMLRLLAQAADVPQEILPGTPLVEITDRSRVLVENHGGVTELLPELIRVRVSYGSLTVRGMDLRIAKMSASQLVITGRIFDVSLEEGAG